LERRVAVAEAHLRTASSPGASSRFNGPSKACATPIVGSFDAEARLQIPAPSARQASECYETCASPAASAFDVQARLRNTVQPASQAGEYTATYGAPATSACSVVHTDAVARLQNSMPAASQASEPVAAIQGGHCAASERTAVVAASVDACGLSNGPQERAIVPCHPSRKPLGPPPSDTDEFLRYLEEFQAYTGKLCAQEAPSAARSLVTSRF
jgi:hypothetical protein